MQGKELPLDAATKELNNGAKGRSIDIDKQGRYAVLGMRDGSVRLYKIAKGAWQLMGVDKTRKSWIQCVKFSPNGRQIAVGSHDGFVDIYDTEPFACKKKMKASSSAVTQLDWS